MAKRNKYEYDVLVWRGITFRRRLPDGKYWWAKAGTKSLHRAIWKWYHGDIPAKHDIHHKDGNPHNNKPSNLECLSKREHRRRHREDHRTPKQLRHLERIRPKAAVWHRSKQGEAWHRRHAQRVWGRENRTERTVRCVECEKDFTTLSFSTPKYCSDRCYDRMRYKRDGRKERSKKCGRQCERCKKRFLAFTHKIRFCSKSCSAFARWRRTSSGV